MVENVSFLKEVLEWAEALVLALIGIVWKVFTGKIDKLEERVDALREHTITKTAFDLHTQEDKQVQRDLSLIHI